MALLTADEIAERKNCSLYMAKSWIEHKLRCKEIKKVGIRNGKQLYGLTRERHDSCK